MHYQLNKWQHSAWKKNTRFYSIDLCQDLWGHWLIMRTWGSNRSRGAGRSTYTVCQNFETACNLYEKQKSRRLKRGYFALEE
jgi:hypothetical protein